MGSLPLNFELLRNPINWIIILLMVASGFLAVDLVLRSAGHHNNHG